MSARVDGMNILISGGSQGLGEAVARLCAAGGASGLVLTARSVDRGEALAAELTAAGTPTMFIATDVSDPSLAATVVAAAVERFGTIHGLVNVAACTDRDNVFNVTADDWHRMLNINVVSPSLLLQGVAASVRAAGATGSVVNVGSTSGHGGQPFLHSYCTSKGALAVLTKNAAYSLMRHGVRVNQINPGWMDTESEAATQKKWHNAGDDWLVAAEAGQPMGRLVKPDEVARAVLFLLSEDSGLMTGAVIDFDQSVIGAGDAPKPSVAETPQ
jgi:NAD(P)-dependent dehydrogenase (short-subunit alcohol dehydrogenase family)